jgi:hypothetical protein
MDERELRCVDSTYPLSPKVLGDFFTFFKIKVTSKFFNTNGKTIEEIFDDLQSFECGVSNITVC